jgi:hypothetical protein
MNQGMQHINLRQLLAFGRTDDRPLLLSALAKLTPPEAEALSYAVAMMAREADDSVDMSHIYPPLEPLPHSLDLGSEMPS